MSTPGLWSAPGPAHCAGEVCITCSDEAVPVRVLALRPDDLALVLTEAGTEEEVSVALVDAAVGDTVLVHAKEALVRLEPGAGR
jgi:hydrogenase expression/formation protein HypC